ncbi:MAG: transketolase family protein [Saprospiraceae bacterium]|nr:transketolase family protein [Saprospiraceae bacterium]
MKQFKLKEYKPTKTGFGEGLAEMGEKYENIIALGADITASVGMNLFAEKFPERFYSLGIAEQNCIGVAAGMALAGKIPFFSTYGVFAALRTTDQIRISLCYNNLHVIIGGAHAGISVGPDGATHQALEDIAIMRVLPNMTVLSPCDATQAKLAVKAAVEQIKGPVYLRFGRDAVPDFTDDNLEFKIGQGQLFNDGSDLTIISTGHLTWEALQAAYKLKEEGISARVINIHTIKPIDKEIIIKAAKETGAIVTAEEHQIQGGFGSAIAEVLAENFPVPVEFVGVNDTFGESGQPKELMEKYGLTSHAIIRATKKVLLRK